MEPKLSSAQQARLAFLKTLPPRFENFHRIIEEMASNHADASRVRQLCRQLDELKATAAAVSLDSLGDVFGMMGMLARRGGGLQMRVRGLREGLTSLKANFEGVFREASTPQRVESELPEPEGEGKANP